MKIVDKVKGIFKKNKDPYGLDEPIRDSISIINAGICGDPEDDAVRIQNVKDLVQIKTDLEGPKRTLDPNTIWAGVFSLLGVGTVVVYENRHVFSTAAKQFIAKVRL